MPIKNQLTLEPANNEQLANLCGPFNQHLQHLERRLGVQISNRAHQFSVQGPKDMVQATEQLLKELYEVAATETLTPGHIHLSLQESSVDQMTELQRDEVTVKTRRGVIRARGANQQHYLADIVSHDINFGIGPAGTGKTYLAVACAVDALERGEVRRILLVRPAVEAGEKLGFLPGDMTDKVDPYLRPLYDALYEMLGFEKVDRLLEKNVIEIAPLAFMRGRTLNESFIILDEAQNTSVEQMKMFLTRIGFGSRAVITGDLTQVDLPRHQRSGLRDIAHVLRNVDGVSFTHFVGADVVRHPLVQRIVEAYEKADVDGTCEPPQRS
jgi:phosphate starvation-inducible PhoH-like protein